jgi:hypothetical protein
MITSLYENLTYRVIFMDGRPINDERVAFPTSDGVPHPRAFWIGLEWPPQSVTPISP